MSRSPRPVLGPNVTFCPKHPGDGWAEDTTGRRAGSGRRIVITDDFGIARTDRDSTGGAPVTRGWIADVLVGGAIGGLVGVIVAVNLVIFSGIEQGYESSLPEVFEYSPIVGIVTVLVLVSGPIVGVVIARRLRRNRATERR